MIEGTRSLLTRTAFNSPRNRPIHPEITKAMKKFPVKALIARTRITSYNVCYTKLLRWWIGVLGLTGVLMSSYMGTQAQAVGVGRFYGGLLGRADRLVLLIVVCIVSLFVPAQLLGLSLFAWLLLIFGILGHVTASYNFV